MELEMKQLAREAHAFDEGWILGCHARHRNDRAASRVQDGFRRWLDDQDVTADERQELLAEFACGAKAGVTEA